MHIPVWKKEKKESTVASIARAVMKGATPEELAKAALLILRESAKADRLGVWLERRENSQEANTPFVFRGFVWDRENVDTPPEWERLAPEYPLPAETVNGATSETVDLENLQGHPIIGPLIGMKTARWTPVGEKHSLRGLIMAATRGKTRDLPATSCEAVAGELNLALAYQEAQRERRHIRANSALPKNLMQLEKLAAVGEMVSGVAHELSNPLTTILGYAQRLLKREQASGTAVEARQIFHEAERAVRILRQLNPSGRESAPLRGKVSLNRVVLQTMEMQRLSVRSENIRTELDLDPLRPSVWGDAGQLQQVLVNLVSNARQAILESGKGGVIRVRTKLLPRNVALLEVSDNGPGIPEAVAARIFDPFFTTKQPGSGTGLGLSIVLGIVREHDGQLNVTSPPGGGTKFSIEWRAMPVASPAPKWLWPAYSGQADAAWLKRGAKTETPLEKNGTTRARVLIVEDEPTVAQLIADVLEDEGYQVDVMLSGREALERARSAQYDLAICDMKMPGLDGQHFFKALVRAENPLRKKLLFITGDGAAPRTREFLERNQLPHVAKPFRVEELSAAVQKILTEKSATVPAANAAAAGKFGGNNA